MGLDVNSILRRFPFTIFKKGTNHLVCWSVGKTTAQFPNKAETPAIRLTERDINIQSMGLIPIQWDYLLLALPRWIAGIVIAKGAWSTVFAITIPFWALYLFIEKLMLFIGLI